MVEHSRRFVLRIPPDLHARAIGSSVEVPRIHDVSSLLEQNRDLAFYGSEDLPPSEFYKKRDAETALAQVSHVVEVVTGAIGG